MKIFTIQSTTTTLSKKCYSLTLLLSIILLSSSCAKITEVSTNLDSENFARYFSPTEVKIADSEKEFTGKFKLLGLVEGEFCQEKAHHAAPNEIDARTEARRKAYKLGANAIIFSQCVLIEEDKAAKYCIASTVCYGRAYAVEDMSDQ